MGDIYANSIQAVVWLGEESATDKLAFDFVPKFVQKSFNTLVNDLDNPSVKRKVFDSVFVDLTDNICLSLTRLFEKSWFLRAWTFQEIVCAPNAELSCGRLTLNYNILIKFVMVFATLKLKLWSSSTVAQYSMGQVCSTFLMKTKRTDGKVTALGLLSVTRMRSATDPRDKMYSLIGLVTEPDSFPYEPGYGICTHQLYQDFARHVINQSKNLDILEHCIFKEEGRVAPTWVPDWRTTEGLQMQINCSEEPFRASRSLPWTSNTSKAPEVLIVEGILLDTTLRLSGNCLELEGNIERYKSFDESYRPLFLEQLRLIEETAVIASSSQSYRTEDDCWQAWWRTAVGARRGNNSRVTQEFGESVRIYRERLSILGSKETNAEPIGAKIHAFVEVEGRFVNMAMERKFCLTQQGRIGWVPKAANEGDVISILPGSAVPVLLRPKGDSYLMIGQCYIHGIMDGEALELNDVGFQKIELI